jgi:hypothetical protein
MDEEVDRALRERMLATRIACDRFTQRSSCFEVQTG